MRKPIIGILGSNGMFTSEKFFVSEKCHVNTSCVTAFLRNGAIPFVIPYISDNEDLYRLLDLCDGILVPGGEDIDPYLFGEHPHKSVGVIRPDIDRFTIKALEYSFDRKKPVLGICKGLQAINIAKGGSIYQDLSLAETETILHNQVYDRSICVHKIKIEKNTILYSVLAQEELLVNSMHHQAIKILGDGLIVSAFAPDDIVEAVESEDGLVFGVQWHPEELLNTEPHMNKLFSYFIDVVCSKF